MSVEVGTYAIHKGEEGIILWDYHNGQCEFKEIDTNKIIVVNVIDLIS
ncbi:hypothetical protein [Bacillus sp. FJAT-45350]|nr:hypothetical protein [Bacillus sp. FJAT-45350]